MISTIILRCGTQITLTELEQALISYVPCGPFDGKDKPLLKFGHLWGGRKRVTQKTYGKKFNGHALRDMNGVQLMTGFPTYCRGKGKFEFLYYNSIDIEHHMVLAYPEQVAKIQQLYKENVIGTPCILETKSGGLRLDAYTEYVGSKMSFKDDNGMLLEVLAHKCLTRIDHRYAMVEGSILDMPTLPKACLQEIYYIAKEIATEEQSDEKPREVVEKSQLGDLEIEWGSNGRSQLFSTQHCQCTTHSSDRDEVRFTKYADGSVDGKCFNCGGIWWEIPPPKKPPQDLQDIEPITTLPPDHPIFANAPAVEVQEMPSFRHFSKEERIVVSEVLQTSPDAGWHGSTPIWTPKYEYLYPLTNKFALNGHPSEIETRRVWLTQFSKCPHCGGTIAKWIDRYLLTAGYYCDSCHKDYPLGSYLEIELNRKLPNSIVSEYEGFLGNNPDFVDFRLFEPGQLTHLGAGMGTGKTTEIVRNLVSLAEQGLGKGIIVVPRISLAQQLAFQLRQRDGHDAWGLWTEGSGRDKFIGRYGAIVCLPSLPQVVHEAERYQLKSLYIAIDELDFSYELLSLSILQATAIKKILRNALKDRGLVVAGQTESTLALEAFAQEIEAEQVQGFYNTAEPADGHVTLKQHPSETNVNALLASGIDDIRELLENGKNVYSFCASRRDGDILADIFISENPLIYNAYTRGDPRALDLLRYQRLTDSRLFIGTSAAGVGVSWVDRKAVTVILDGLIFGSRHANMSVQKGFRDRGRRGLLMHYKSYNFSLPVRPTENREVSLYHEALKQALDENLTVPEHAVSKIAAAQALASLADMQIETFFRYHLGTVGNMDVRVDTPAAQPKDVAEAIGEQRAVIRKIENELKKEQATVILNSILNDNTDTQLLTAGEIRRARNQGRFSTDAALANELANEAARAVGWNDEVDRFKDSDGDPFKGIFTEADIEVARALVDRNFDLDALVKKRAGYLAVNAPMWTARRFELEVQDATRQLTLAGLGVEITAVKDYRFLGELLTELLEKLVGTVFEEKVLAETVTSVLHSRASSGKPFGQELNHGALGASEYRKARFLDCAEDGQVLVNWVARFISEWYPARLAKKEEFYALQPDTHAQLYLNAFERWLRHQPGVLDNTQIELELFSPTELPEANAEQRELARNRRREGATLKAIAEELDVEHQTISKWCKGITPKRRTKQTRSERQKERQSTKQANNKKQQERINEAYRLYTQENLSYEEIAKRMGIKSHTTVMRWFKDFDF